MIPSLSGKKHHKMIFSHLFRGLKSQAWFLHIISHICFYIHERKRPKFGKKKNYFIFKWCFLIAKLVYISCPVSQESFLCTNSNRAFGVRNWWHGQRADRKMESREKERVVGRLRRRKGSARSKLPQIPCTWETGVSYGHPTLHVK